jgi:6-phosphofructokinase 1
MAMRVGMLTGGGDCPGLNAVLRAVVRKGERHFGDELIGFLDGWRGVVEGRTVPLDVERLRGTLPRGGTVIGSSRTNPFKVDGGVERCRAILDELGIDALVAIGGEDTLGVADKLHQQGVPVVGVPKTIDNDLSATELTFGFDTAVQIATEAIDRLHTTAESHHRVMVVEVMGRHAGHIAVWSGIAGGATMILIPEEPFDVEAVCEALRARHAKGNYASIVVVAEGAVPREGSMALASEEKDAFGHVRLGGIGQRLAEEIEDRTGFETRPTILGHVQRGGTPTAFDRVLATRFGIAAIDAVHDGAFGTMVALRAGEIVRVPLAEAVGELKLVDPALYHGVAEWFFAG